MKQQVPHPAIHNRLEFCPTKTSPTYRKKQLQYNSSVQVRWLWHNEMQELKCIAKDTSRFQYRLIIATRVDSTHSILQIQTEDWLKRQLNNNKKVFETPAPLQTAVES